MATPTQATPARRRRAWLDIVVFGLAGGVLTAVLTLTEYRFLVVEHSVAIYGALIAVLFAGIGIWLGVSLRRKRADAVEPQGPVSVAFSLDESRREALGITARELEILSHMAAGLSNQEIAERLFISENTVKTHASRVFGKLGAKRRTQAIQIGRAARLIP